MTKTAIQIAIEKVDEQIEIAQFCRIESSKIKDATSTNRHYGMKIALVCIRQVLVNLLELEKKQIMQAVYDSMGTNSDPNIGRAELYYNETYKSK